MRKYKRIAVVVSHPIQHFCPQYASWAVIKGLKLKVFFGSRLGASNYYDKDFKQHISWDNLYLNEFEHEFLNGDKVLPADKDLAAANLEASLSAFNPDLVIHYGYFQKLSRQAKDWAVHHKVKLAYISDAEFRQQRPMWKRLLKFPFLFKYFNKIDYFLTVGDANEAYYNYYGVPKDKIKRMHFPIDIRLYKTAWENRETLRNSFREQNNISGDELVISVVGKLVGWKSQDDLIQLLINLEPKEFPKKITLLIAGSGPEEAAWKQQATCLVKNKVVFLGFVKPENLPEIYAATDVYIHPAKIEPHSLSISEAIYMGCPVILANTCGSWGLRDDVIPEINGLTYPHGDLKELERLLGLLLASTEMEMMGDISHTNAVSYQEKAHGGFLENL